MPLYPGSTDQPTLTVDPYDGTTAATVVITPVTGSPLSPTATTTDSGQTWRATAVYPTAGKWVAKWTVAGTGAGIAYQDIHVSNPAGPSAAELWRPEPWQVAAYVPRRTLVGAVDGYGNALETFDESTHPRLGTVNLLISDACAWVRALVNPVNTGLYSLATTAASLYAAWAIEQGYPDNRDDLTNAQALYDRAASMRADLDRANEAITGTDPEDPAAVVMPVWAFPTPVAWGDLDL